MGKNPVWIGMAVLLGVCSCSVLPCATRDDRRPLTYRVRKLTSAIKIDANWDKPAWRDVEPLILGNYMGEKPKHRPTVQAKLAYDDNAIYVIFHVEDRYVRAVAQNYHDPVCKDSCVEFFFTPGTELGLSYFNMEINCGGTMLFCYHPVGKKSVRIAASDCDKVEIGHTLPKTIDPEVTEPTTWTVECRLPMDVILKYCPAAVRPAPGIAWRANFYKCADATSHPHWLTWSFVDYQRPRFHMPECFGSLVFE